MIAVLVGTAYFVLHLTLCGVAARLSPAFRSERGIFLLHVVSYMLAVMATGIAAWMLDRGHLVQWVVLAAGLHGIYSLSFLEVWSLTQGSYSLSLLVRVAELGPEATHPRLQALQSVGMNKQAHRQDDLIRMGLLRMNHNQEPRLSRLGAICARTFRAIRWLTNGRPLNP